MNFTPKIIKRNLKKCILEIASHPEYYAKNPSKDFTRVRKLPLQSVVRSVLSMTGKSLCGEIMESFSLSSSMPTVSAFVQQRNKLDYRALETLFHAFVNSVDEQKLFKGYRLLAVDGSDLHTPTNRNEPESFHQGTNGQRPYNLLHLNALYDLQRRIYVDAIVQGRNNINEHKAFVTMVDRDTASIPTIYIADRGYESYNSIAHIIEKGQKFLIRAKDVGKYGVASKLPIPDRDEFDVSVSFGLTRRQTKETKQSNLKFIPHTSTFDYLPKKPDKFGEIQAYYMSFRVVRVKITENTYELLFTNLTENEFNISELKELYAMRWGIETSFRDLKYSIALSFFHSKKTEYILQEIFAKLTMYNFAELITSHVVIKQKNRKYPYRINFACAVHICRNFFLENISPSNVEALLQKNLLPVRHGASNLRRRSYKSAPSFLYRIP